MNVKELKDAKTEMERTIKDAIEKFVYETDSIPKNIKIDIHATRSITGRVVLYKEIDIHSDLEI